MRRQILNKSMDMGILNVLSLIYSCFVLRNIYETLNGSSMDENIVARQLAHDRLHRHHQGGPD